MNNKQIEELEKLASEIDEIGKKLFGGDEDKNSCGHHSQDHRSFHISLNLVLILARYLKVDPVSFADFVSGDAEADKKSSDYIDKFKEKCRKNIEKIEEEDDDNKIDDMITDLQKLKKKRAKK